MKKRFLSMLLALTMCVGVAIPVFAAEPEVPETADKNCVTQVFEDVYPTMWYVPFIQNVYNKGLMTGVSDTMFAPNRELNRAMVAQILYSAAGKPEVTTESAFTDMTNTESWYYDAVVWATGAGVVCGYTNNTFRPYNNITREEFVQMMYAMAGKPSIKCCEKSLSVFPDARDVSEWATDAFTWAINNAIVTGMPKGNENWLAPQGLTTRAQAAAIISGYFAVPRG